MPDKLRPVILGLMEAGRVEEAGRLLAQEDAVWQAVREEVGERVVASLLSENIACACGHCGVVPPREYIFGLMLLANGELL